MHLRIEEAISRRSSILIETTLSGNTHDRTITRCQTENYRLALHYVFLTSLPLAQARVALRVGLGGHDVPLEDQLRRYKRSLSNAAEIVDQFDEAFFYNNDSLDGHELVAEFIAGKSKIYNQNYKDWLPSQT